ncbi:hypothetical protein G9464_05935 [Halostella sp. JP-L12]|uniref:hypothetical protein n=1 Tax=Halostella TaxID=1843185 RepID=UPI0013CEDF86|nr:MULTISPECIES: hypothetical protein [Halostella]NHN47139.1 hypothetical protein [Halostella sp. JP-L12]
MARLLSSLRGESEETETTLDVTVEREDPTPSPRKGLRKAALGLGVLALAYVASRRAGSGEVVPDELREKASDALPTDTGESTGEPESGAAIVERMHGGDGDGTAGAEPIANYLSGEGPSDEVIAGRAEEEVDEEPAEPGEMNVDEEVVDEIIDDDEEST